MNSPKESDNDNMSDENSIQENISHNHDPLNYNQFAYNELEDHADRMKKKKRGFARDSKEWVPHSSENTHNEAYPRPRRQNIKKTDHF